MAVTLKINEFENSTVDMFKFAFVARVYYVGKLRHENTIPLHVILAWNHEIFE